MQPYTIVEKHLTSQDQQQNVIAIETIPKGFAQSASDILFLQGQPIILVQDPIVQYSFDTLSDTTIAYAVKGVVDIPVARSSSLVLLPKQGAGTATAQTVQRGIAAECKARTNSPGTPSPRSRPASAQVKASSSSSASSSSQPSSSTTSGCRAMPPRRRPRPSYSLLNPRLSTQRLRLPPHHRRKGRSQRAKPSSWNDARSHLPAYSSKDTR